MADNATATNSVSANNAQTQNASANSAQQNTQQNVQQNVQSAPIAQNDVVDNPNPLNTEKSADVQDVANLYEQATQEQQEQQHVPIQYNFKQEYGFSAEDNTKLTDVFKKAKLSQEQADILLNAYHGDIANLGQQFDNELQTAIVTQRNTWANQVKADSELGGQNFANTKLNIGRVMQQFGTPELKNFLNESGLGYNPDFVRFMNKVGTMIGNDSNFINSNGAIPTEQEKHEQMLRNLYPNSKELFE